MSLKEKEPVEIYICEHAGVCKPNNGICYHQSSHQLGGGCSKIYCADIGKGALCLKVQEGFKHKLEPACGSCVG